MTTNPFHMRHVILLAIIVFYLSPILAICIYLTTFVSFKDAWNIFSGGLLLTFTGSIILFWIMHSWEKSLHSQVIAKDTHPEESESSIPIEQEESSVKPQMEKLQNELSQLSQEVQTKTEELQILQRDKELSQKQYEQLSNDYQRDKIALQDQLEQHKSFIHELQDTIDQQRSTIEKKQQQISQLETKVGDLTYEIKTLLHLAESTTGSNFDKEPSKGSWMDLPTKSEALAFPSDEEDSLHYPNAQTHSCDDAMMQLKRCLDIAQKMTGSAHFGSENSRLRDLSVDNFALDLRRLCDSLRSENNSAILLYSPTEDKLIFANNQVKTLLGWSPDKLVQNFSEIIQEGEKEWKSHLAHISLKNESQARLLMRTKKGHDLLVHCHLGVIPTGVFRYHVIGVLHPA